MARPVTGRPPVPPPPPSPTRELRLGLVCYGGVSLAIYMHGVTKEIHKLVLAAAAFDSDLEKNPFAEATSEHAYWTLLKRMHDSEIGTSGGLRTRVVVDVISGTSAGGINGICLAKALALNQSQEALKRLWFERGDINELAAAPKRLPLRLKAPWLMLKSTVAGTSPLRGTDMCRWLFDAFTQMDQARSSYPDPLTLLPPYHTLDLFVTTTDFRGYPRELPIYDPRVVKDLAHRHVMAFHHESVTDTDFGPGKNHVLAFAARATSSFPGAFPPVTFRDYEDCFTVKPDLETLARKQFAVYFGSDVDPLDSAFVDGGVLNNAPFALAIRATKAKPAAFEVVRRLLYIEPDPIPQGSAGPTPERSNGDAPGWLATIWAGLSSIPSSQPVLDDLNALAERNRVVRRIRDIIEASFDTIRDQVKDLLREAGIDVKTLGVADGSRLLRLRDLIATKTAASAATGAGYALATYRRLRLRFVLRRYAAMIAAGLEFEPETHPARFIETVARDWALATKLLNQIESTERVIEDLGAQTRFLADVDLDYDSRRIEFVIAALNWWYAKAGEPGYPTRPELDSAKARLYQYLAALRSLVPRIAGTTGREPLLRAFPRSEVLRAARDQERDYVARHRETLDTLRAVMGRAIREGREELEADLYAHLIGLGQGWSDEVRLDLLVRYLGFPFWDILVFPVQAVADVNERDHVEVVRVSPYDATLLERDGARKLKGTGLFHFAAFFDRAYRENDYLWGRLDAAERLVGLLLDDADQPGIPAEPAACQPLFAAIMAEEAGALPTIPETVRDLRARVEGLGRATAGDLATT